MTTLTEYEMYQAGCHAILRRIKGINKNLARPYGESKGDLWGQDIESTAAEMLVAKTLGKYWNIYITEPNAPGANTDGDVGDVEVRHTKYTSGKLLLHDRDRDEAVFVLVVGKYPRYRIAGWLTAGEGKRPELVEEYDGRSAYFVPQTELHSIDSIPK